MPATQATRRKEYLDGLAATGLAQEDADAARRKEIEDLQEQAEQQRRDNVAKREAARAAWLEAVGEMQEHAKGFVAALERGLEAADGAGGIGSSNAARMVRVSKYLSGEFRRLLGPTAPRFGEMSITSFPPRPIANWIEQEEKL